MKADCPPAPPPASPPPDPSPAASPPTTPTPLGRPSTSAADRDPATPPPEEEEEEEAEQASIGGAPSPPSAPALSLPARAYAAACSTGRSVVTAILRAGPIPAHVAFIMDGNRRYAEGRGAAVSAGHEAGYQKLIDALDWCLALGTSTVSVFAFSVDNFRRPAAEVAALMGLAADRLGRLARPDGEAGTLLARHGVRVRVLGDRSLLPPAVADAADAAEASTAGHAGGKTLHICLAYAARLELAGALAGAAGEVVAAEGEAPPPPPSSSPNPSPLLRPGALPALLGRHLYTAGAPPVDLLVRSSGEARLSDFLTWQARAASLAWARPLWPDLGFLDLARAVAAYQRASPALEAIRAAAGVVGVSKNPAVAWAARPAVPPPPFRKPLRRTAGSDDEEEDPDDPLHRFDPQCPCCLPNVLRRRVVPVSVPAGAPPAVLAAAAAAAAAEAASQPAGLEDVFAAKKAREAAVRAALAAERETREGA